MTPARDRGAVIEAVREVEASTVVVGLPLSLSGRSGPAARAALAEAGALRALLEPARRRRRDGRRALHDGGGRALPAGGGADREGGPQGGRQRSGDGAAASLAGQRMSGPTGPHGARAPEQAARASDEELPWPQPEAPGLRQRDRSPTAGWTSPTDGSRADDRTRGGTAERDPRPVRRRAARAARVRRRRRVLAGVGGGLLVLVLAFVLWYELESHALGPQGRQVVVTVHEGESTGRGHRLPECRST